jgi:hypothetical protein
MRMHHRATKENPPLGKMTPSFLQNKQIGSLSPFHPFVVHANLLFMPFLIAYPLVIV